MGSCSSTLTKLTVDRIHLMISSVDKDDVESVQRVLLKYWNLYNDLPKKDRKLLDELAQHAHLKSHQVNNLSP